MRYPYRTGSYAETFNEAGWEKLGAISLSHLPGLGYLELPNLFFNLHIAFIPLIWKSYNPENPGSDNREHNNPE